MRSVLLIGLGILIGAVIGALFVTTAIWSEDLFHRYFLVRPDWAAIALAFYALCGASVGIFYGVSLSTLFEHTSLESISLLKITILSLFPSTLLLFLVHSVSLLSGVALLGFLGPIMAPFASYFFVSRFHPHGKKAEQDAAANP